jgi:hypothetical protein
MDDTVFSMAARYAELLSSDYICRILGQYAGATKEQRALLINELDKRKIGCSASQIDTKGF